MSSAWDDARKLVQRYKELVAAVTSAFVLLPLAAHQVDLTPPWPAAVVLVTALVQLVVALVMFTFVRQWSNRRSSRFLLLAAVGLMISSTAYMVAVSHLTFVGGPAKERLVKGYACTTEALRLQRYADKCPLLNDGLIATAERADELWTTESIALARMTLLLLWLLSFALFAATATTFIVSQSQQPSRFLRSKKPRTRPRQNRPTPERPSKGAPP